jgi:putative transposase
MCQHLGAATNGNSGDTDVSPENDADQNEVKLTASAVSHERSGTMKRSKFSEEQIVYAIRQAEAGTPVGDLCRQLGVSDATFYVWKKKYAHLGVSELRRLRQLEEENSRLKWLVADLSLDKHMLSEALRKKV